MYELLKNFGDEPKTSGENAWILLFTIKNSLIAFGNTIRMWAERLIVSADALIVVGDVIRTAKNMRKLTPPYMLFLCCHVVTLSHFEYNYLKIYLLCAWQQCDNKISLSHCCHALKHLYINAFPPPWQRDNKKWVFSGVRK